jgi:hypothetical protein
MEEFVLRVRYSRMWGAALLISGLLLLAMYVTLWIMKGSTSWWPFPLCFFIAGSGLAYMYTPYFLLRKKSIVVYSLFGLVKTYYHFEHLRDLVFEGDNIFLTGGKKRKRVWVGRLMSNKEDWWIFEQEIRKSQPDLGAFGKR